MMNQHDVWWNVGRRSGAALLLFAVSACGSDINTEFPRPREPFPATLYDLVAGPIDRASALNVVSGRSLGVPTVVRVDQSDSWDIAYAVIDGSPVWLPRGFFEGLEPDSGILEALRDFDEILEAPGERESYEFSDPVPISEGKTYIVRSRNAPGLSLPCRIYAKVLVQQIEVDPPRVKVLYLWNPNCDGRNLRPQEAG